MPQPILQTPRISTELNQLSTSTPEIGSKFSYMNSGNELGIEVEILETENNLDPAVLPECVPEFILNIFMLTKTDSIFIAFNADQPSSSQKPNVKSYQKETTVDFCAPTEDVRQDEVIFSGKVEIISEEKYFLKIVKKLQNNSIIPDYVHQRVGEEIILLKMDLKCKYSCNYIPN
ncbi:hypothetical protein O181_028478 [Austropuccinia psidii MF-1]|uniref:Uncharacterized protein n=1 Tax=Austropuccinia psidii MF-1 TaxID=1389203 RepID=A0A9Q3CRM0_9BASI|nr:hypothetical protein [Austropuccinia psidii MF-1]